MPIDSLMETPPFCHSADHVFGLLAPLKTLELQPFRCRHKPRIEGLYPDSLANRWHVPLHGG